MSDFFSQMPEVIRAALFGTSPIERDSVPYVRPTNPWTPKIEGDGRLNFITDETEEAALQEPLDPIRKLFTPRVVRTVPKLGDLPKLPPEDPDASEREFYTPVRKLFYPDVISSVARPETANRFQFTKRAATAASETSDPPSDEFNQELDAVLRAALDQAVNDCLPSDESESTADFFRRVDRRLEAQGHRPILSVPTSVYY